MTKIPYCGIAPSSVRVWGVRTQAKDTWVVGSVVGALASASSGRRERYPDESAGAPLMRKHIGTTTVWD
jgi:hypothetical protein